MKYCESQLSVTEAQNLSENGIAVLGNPFMRDVIWEHNCPNPLAWVTNAYRPLKPETFVNRKGWLPDKPKGNYDDL